MKRQGLGRARLGAVAGPGDHPLRRQHLVRAGDARPTGRCSCSTPAPGIRHARPVAAGDDRPLHILLTHLHLDHIQGLMFFAPLFGPAAEIVIWGPAAPEAPLRDRIARYISAPLSPVEVRELPVRRVVPRSAATASGTIGPATHPRRARSPTAARRSATASARATPRSATSPTTSRRSARRSRSSSPSGSPATSWPATPSLLLHDCQYSDDEYPDHMGWGHSSLSRRAGLRPPRGAERAAAASTTIRCTPTPSWTGSGGSPSSAGWRWAARPTSWRWPASATSSSSAPPPRLRPSAPPRPSASAPPASCGSSRRAARARRRRPAASKARSSGAMSPATSRSVPFARMSVTISAQSRWPSRSRSVVERLEQLVLAVEQAVADGLDLGDRDRLPAPTSYSLASRSTISSAATSRHVGGRLEHLAAELRGVEREHALQVVDHGVVALGGGG